MTVAPPGRLPAGVTAAELFEASPDGLVVVDERGTVLAVNDRLLAMLGWSREQLVGRPVEALGPPGVRDRHVGHRAGFGASPRARGMGLGEDLRALTAEGELLPVDVVLGPLPGAGPGCVLASVRDVSRRRQREADWEHRALHDPLTGLANRSLVHDRLEHASLRARRSGAQVAVVFLDLERFKAVNDEHGHGIGDVLLRTVGERLREATRPGDTVGRVGGDEFVVVVEDAVPSAASAYAERLRAVVSAPVEVEGTRLEVGCSVGVALAEPGRPWTDVLERADTAMYEDKARRAVPQQR